MSETGAMSGPESVSDRCERCGTPVTLIDLEEPGKRQYAGQPAGVRRLWYEDWRSITRPDGVIVDTQKWHSPTRCEAARAAREES